MYIVNDYLQVLDKYTDIQDYRRFLTTIQFTIDDCLLVNLRYFGEYSPTSKVDRCTIHKMPGVIPQLIEVTPRELDIFLGEQPTINYFHLAYYIELKQDIDYSKLVKNIN